ncbi:MAG: hypothetical protein IPK82_02635 [Polyangiaceae bacterium]|nr:hypothetical protein [Polyangiaceae bacterium]
MNVRVISCLFPFAFVACTGNVATETSGSGAAAGSAGATAGSNPTGTGGASGSTESVGGFNMGLPNCTPEIDAAVDNVPQLGLEPKSNFAADLSYPMLVNEATPTSLTLVSEDGSTSASFAWVGPNLTLEFAPGKTAWASAAPGLPWSVVNSGFTDYATYQETKDGSLPPEVTPPHGELSIGFYPICKYKGDECQIVHEIHAGNGFAITVIGPGESAVVEGFEVSHLASWSLTCDTVGFSANFTMSVSTEGPP